MLHTKNLNNKSGFTLVELSIVLIIIGLIVSGVLVGQDLIRSAEISATVRQVQNFNSAVSTFRTKYNYIPGDMPSSLSTAFGLTGTRTGAQGDGDGNGLIECTTPATLCSGGEPVLFWNDLSISKLVSGSYTGSGTAAIASTALGSNFPEAKLGKNNYFFVYSVSGINYYQIAAISSVDASSIYTLTTGITPAEAYQIDSKLDDGLPSSGIVTAVGGTTPNGTATTTATAGSAGCVYTAVTPNPYNAAFTSGACQLRIRMF